VRPHTPPMAFVEEEFRRNQFRFHQNPSSTRSWMTTCAPTPVWLLQVQRRPWMAPLALFRRRNSSTWSRIRTFTPTPVRVVTGTTTAMEGATCTIQEEFPIVAPPPLNTVEECDQTPPNLFSPEQLELIFDIRGYMADQLHRDTLINNRIDMLFDAFSNAPAKQRCPTCAQPFVLQPNDGILHSGALDDRFHGSHNPSNV
jgi:hypothetical protein